MNDQGQQEDSTPVQKKTLMDLITSDLPAQKRKSNLSASSSDQKKESLNWRKSKFNRKATVFDPSLFEKIANQNQLEVAEEQDNNIQLDQQDSSVIPLRDQIILGPIDRYEKYHIFPWKYLLHVIILICTTAQIYLLLDQEIFDSRSTVKLFYDLFQHDEDGSGSLIEQIGSSEQIFNVKDLQTSISKTVDEYYSIGETQRMTTYRPHVLDYINNETQPVTLSVFNITQDDCIYTDNNSTNCHYIWELTDTDLGPFQKNDTNPESSYEAIKDFTHQASYMTLDFGIIQELSAGLGCMNWTVTQIYDFQTRSLMEKSLQTVRKKCYHNRVEDYDQSESFGNRDQTWALTILCTIVSFIGIVFQVKEFIDMAQGFQRMKDSYEKKMRVSLAALGINADEIMAEDLPRDQINSVSYLEIDKENQEDKEVRERKESLDQGTNSAELIQEEEIKSNKNSANSGSESEVDQDYENKQFLARYLKKKLSWKNKSVSEKFALINKWAIVTLIGNIMTFFGSLFFLDLTTFDVKNMEVFLGIGCMLTWFSFQRYYENNRDFNTITRTANTAIPIILRTVLGILPTLIGFSLLGISILWPYADKFSSFSGALIILFCVMNGDSISDVFIGSTRARLILGQIYWYCFIIIGICVFQNILFVIVEDAYMTVKYQKSYEWARTDDEISEHSDNEENKDHFQSQSSDSQSSDEGDFGNKRPDKQNSMQTKQAVANFAKQLMKDVMTESKKPDQASTNITTKGSFVDDLFVGAFKNKLDRKQSALLKESVDKEEVISEQTDVKQLAKEILDKSKLQKFTNQLKNTKIESEFKNLTENENLGQETIQTLKGQLAGDIERQMDDLMKLKQHLMKDQK